MASVLKSSTFTLSAGVAVSTTLQQYWDVVEVLNHSTTDKVYARSDGTTAVSAAANNEAVLPGERLSIRVQWDYTTPTAPTGIVSVISAGTPDVTVVGA